MTKVWGPMGWMTLHSISICYPDEPTDVDKRILNEFMNAFGGSITCVHCRQHFAKMFSDYKSKIPSWLNTKKDLFLAICRMHNAVNKRLDKPQPKTVAECLAFLKLATSYTSPRDFREKYSAYLLRDWKHHRQTGDGVIGYKNSEIVAKINNEYWNQREVSYNDIKFDEDDVLTYSSTVKAPERTVIPKFNLSRLLGKH